MGIQTGRTERPTDREKIHFNLAKIKKEGEMFEVVVDPDLAIEYKHGKNIDIKDVLKSEKIMNDAKKKLFASETEMKAIFGTDDHLKVADIIIREGAIELTEEYRKKLREEKKRKIISIISRNCVDPKTDIPHPPQRIENAIDEAKVKIDEMKPAEAQIEAIVKQLQPILAIKFEVEEIYVHVPAKYSSSSHNIIKSYGKILKESWNADNSLSLTIEIPAGIKNDFFDRLNAITHGTVETRIEKKK
jgi:ribosome maturation protein SDO1